MRELSKFYRIPCFFCSLLIGLLAGGCDDDGDGPYSCEPVASTVVANLQAPLAEFERTPAEYVYQVEGSWAGTLQWDKNNTTAPHAETSTPVTVSIATGAVRFVEVEFHDGDQNGASPEPCGNFLEIDVNITVATEDAGIDIVGMGVVEVKTESYNSIQVPELTYIVDWQEQAGQFAASHIEQEGSIEGLQMFLKFHNSIDGPVVHGRLYASIFDPTGPLATFEAL